MSKEQENHLGPFFIFIFAGLLARLVPVLGKGQALWLTSVLFGLAHWFGYPAGPTGVILAGIAGWVWARSMLETRGFTCPG